MSKNTRIILADPQYLSRKGLRFMIDSHPFYEVVGEAIRHDELEIMMSNTDFDLIMIDYNQPGHFDIDTISMIYEKKPTTKVVIVSDDNSNRNIYQVLERGISNFVTKKCSHQEIDRAIDAAINRQKYFCSKILDIIIDKSFGVDQRINNIEILTEREKDVLTHIASGHSAKEISSELNISIHTVYTHRKNIMKKLNIHSPVELVMYAINNNLVNL